MVYCCRGYFVAWSLSFYPQVSVSLRCKLAAFCLCGLLLYGHSAMLSAMPVFLCSNP